MIDEIEKLEEDWLRLEREADKAKSLIVRAVGGNASVNTPRANGNYGDGDGNAEHTYARAEAAAKQAYDRLWDAYSMKEAS
ncbi:MAG: hypothetical protein V3V97_15435 [Hyphomicrobiaceae bacterium]